MAKMGKKMPMGKKKMSSKKMPLVKNVGMKMLVSKGKKASASKVVHKKGK